MTKSSRPWTPILHLLVSIGVSQGASSFCLTISQDVNICNDRNLYGIVISIVHFSLSIVSATSFPCSFHCNTAVVGEVTECMTSCCYRDKCNQAMDSSTTTTRGVVVLQKKKRSFNDAESGAPNLRVSYTVSLSVMLMLLVKLFT